VKKTGKTTGQVTDVSNYYIILLYTTKYMQTGPAIIIITLARVYYNIFMYRYNGIAVAAAADRI